MTTGLLLLNVGTPAAPTPRAVRRYLRQFLSDPYVLDMNPIGRFLLLELVILPRRPRASAAAYQKVWTEHGSPLLVHGRALSAAVAGRLGANWRVELAMRYGEPSIAAGLAALNRAGVDRVVAMPLFPQRSLATTGTIEAAVRAARGRTDPPVVFAPPFHADPGFVAAFAAVAAPVIAEADHVLMSFHGLPERHIRKADPGQHCLTRPDCCDTLGDHNRDCYRAQCFATASRLAEALSLADDRWSIGFQSRLGRAVWIGPHTDAAIADLAAAGVKRLAVMCPAFVADCLETLEEIGIRGDQQFRAAGGDRLTLVPSLNSTPLWADAVAALARAAAET